MKQMSFSDLAYRTKQQQTPACAFARSQAQGTFSERDGFGVAL